MVLDLHYANLIAILVILIVLKLYTMSYILGFVQTPSPQNVSAGEIATFQCQHSTADLSTWKLNGTLLNSYTPPNTSVVNSLLSNGDFVSRLVITALTHYNTTQIVCVAIFTSGIEVESTPAVLLIQGIHTHILPDYSYEMRIVFKLANSILDLSLSSFCYIPSQLIQ